MKILYFFLFFVGHFCPPGSGSGIWMRIRIRIQQLKLMRIHADPDPDPKPCWPAYNVLGTGSDVNIKYWPYTVVIIVLSRIMHQYIGATNHLPQIYIIYWWCKHTKNQQNLMTGAECKHFIANWCTWHCSTNKYFGALRYIALRYLHIR
jgi:hypothetical protein